jgi:hypothetical protein
MLLEVSSQNGKVVKVLQRRSKHALPRTPRVLLEPPVRSGGSLRSPQTHADLVKGGPITSIEADPNPSALTAGVNAGTTDGATEIVAGGGAGADGVTVMATSSGLEPARTGFTNVKDIGCR